MENSNLTIKVKVELEKLRETLNKMMVTFNAHKHNVSYTPTTYPRGFRLDPICTCGAGVGMYKQGHSHKCSQWVFADGLC
jgi:hypothetical protein